MYRAHARSMKKHGIALNDQAKQCLACHKNKGGQRVGINKTIKMVCGVCGKTKTCKKCYGMLLCSSCICTVGMIKKRPEKILPLWERFGPADTPLSKSPAIPAVAIAAPATPISSEADFPFPVLLNHKEIDHYLKIEVKRIKRYWAELIANMILKEWNHNAKDVSFDQGAADTAGHLSELQEGVPACGEENDTTLQKELPQSKVEAEG